MGETEDLDTVQDEGGSDDVKSCPSESINRRERFETLLTALIAPELNG